MKRPNPVLNIWTTMSLALFLVGFAQYMKCRGHHLPPIVTIFAVLEVIGPLAVIFLLFILFREFFLKGKKRNNLVSIAGVKKGRTPLSMN